MLARCADRERHVVNDDLLLAGVLRTQPVGLCRVESDGREMLECRRENEHLHPKCIRHVSLAAVLLGHADRISCACSCQMGYSLLIKAESQSNCF